MAETRYGWEQAADGTFAIRGVPVFELGEHRGFRYDEAWARKALKTFVRLKSEHGYLPPVILGHTTEEGDEKPAVGFLDRLRLVGSRLVADIVGLSKKLFEQIRAGRWPYRSVEVFDRAAQVTALALLGGTPPYMKTAPLHFADDGSAAVWIEGNHLPRLEKGEPGRTNHGGTMQEPDRNEVKQFSEEDVRSLVEAARAEERTRMEATLQSTRKRLEHLEAEAHAAQVRAFRAELREFGYSPAIIESPEMSALVDQLTHQQPVRFGEEDLPPVTLFGRVLGLIAQRAAQGSAFVETAELSRSGRHHAFGAESDADGGEDRVAAQFGERVDPASVRRYVRARDLAKSEGITFREALMRGELSEFD